MDDVETRFEQLQRELVALWKLIGRSDPGGPLEDANTVVVVPSLNVDVDLPSSVLQAYEERFLFMLFLLRQPLIRLIYVTSQAIPPGIVDYYLHILPGAVISNTRKRLSLVAPLDASSRPLTQKLLERPRLLQEIRSLIPDPARAHIVPFSTTELERELAVRLGIPMYAADPRFFAFGTKSGCRRIFAEEGVPHPLGVEDLFSADEIVGAIAGMRAQMPSMRRVIVKLNEGVSGMGNAVVDLEGLPSPGDPTERAALAERLRGMRYELPSIQYESYVAKVVARGAIVEEMIVGEQIESPSAQLRVSPLGDVELLSTHDQMLGGPSGQSYLGARFPANPAYAPQIMRAAAKIGQRFAREGIVGRFAIDFVVVRLGDGGWEPFAIEVNLRKGGTTHPFLTLQYLTDGAYHPERGVFTTARDHEKSYVASDHVESPSYRALTPDALFDIVSRHRLHFDHTSQTGVVMHMLSCVSSLGRLGVTAIADTPAEANALYQKFVAVLDEEARLALEGI
ncbi:MAG: hypothetical protein H0V51_08400 [Chloroflexi bacterium]|nr:hypothetical protein [Chloroflexota bacterium]